MGIDGRVAPVKGAQKPLRAELKHQCGGKGKESGSQKRFKLESDNETPPRSHDTPQRYHLVACSRNHFAAKRRIQIDALRKRLGEEITPHIADQRRHAVHGKRRVFRFAKGSVDLCLFRYQPCTLFPNDGRLRRLIARRRGAKLLQPRVDLGKARAEGNARFQKLLGKAVKLKLEIGKRLIARRGLGKLLVDLLRQLLQLIERGPLLLYNA
ncbi:hypothetical protein C037_01211 [Brucella suis 63/198]|nr:hypothetical protein C037_01211 [Brucella suis 63/198]